MLGSLLSLNRFAEWVERRSWLNYGCGVLMYAAPSNQVSEDACQGRKHRPRFTISLKRSTQKIFSYPQAAGRLPHL
jgi:hypothetical protein